jgi:group II intron reverse transcriptase/maturase
LAGLLKSGKYRAPPVKRAYIPKAGSENEKRPIGIPAYGDKILQRAVAMALEPIPEKEFYGFSYGFRPGKPARHALERLWKEGMGMNGGCAIDMDIGKYFGTIGRGLLKGMLSRRVSGGAITRIIGKWLNAGVTDAGKRIYPEKGTPQGGVIPPLLGNLFLHEALGNWFVKAVKPRTRGKAGMARYAGGAVIMCGLQEDAERIYKVPGARFEKYGLKIHPEKTKLLYFTKPAAGQRKGNGSFTFLGFTRYRTKSRKVMWMAGRKTDSKRLHGAIKAISARCKVNRHRPVQGQWAALKAKITGRYACCGISLNFLGISEFYEPVRKVWLKRLNRRGRQGKRNWNTFAGYLKGWPLPKPRIMHSYCSAKL